MGAHSLRQKRPNPKRESYRSRFKRFVADTTALGERFADAKGRTLYQKLPTGQILNLGTITETRGAA